ncbi:MAG: ATP-binding protein [Pseudomonas sp.]
MATNYPPASGAPSPQDHEDELHRAFSAGGYGLGRAGRALIELGDRIRDLDDTAALAFAAAEILGRALQVSRVGYGTIDPVAETITIERDWNAPGIKTIAGVLNFREYGTYIDDLKRGDTVVVRDVTEDLRTRANAEQLKQLSAHSFINMPIIEKGRPVALLYLNHGVARQWTEEELVLIREVAERTRMATERCRAREDLRELAASLERQVEVRTAERDRAWKYSRDLQVVVDSSGIVRASNEAWMSILGWNAEEVVGRHCQAFCHPDDLETYGGMFDRSDQTAPPANEVRCLHKDASYRWISWVAAQEGDLIYASGRNVTEEKAAAIELELTQVQLRQSQKMEAVGQLTGRFAHDFNNLLTVIRSSSDLLKRSSISEERRLRLVEAISEAVERGTSLTSQLLSFARRQALHPSPMDVNASVTQIGNTLASRVGPGIHIVMQVRDEPCVINVDFSQFEAAIFNMAFNALDAMSDIGELVISVAPTDIIPATQGYPLIRGSFIAITLGDNGSGIDPLSLDRVFEPFFSTKDAGQGVGLGLSQVFGFAKQSGGEIRVVSHLGHGSTFTLYLPRS